MKILNYGSLNIDHVYHVPHFVRPGETLSSLDMQLFAGGKGLNQSIALARAGADVWHAGAIGKDGGMLSGILKDSNVNTGCRAELYPFVWRSQSDHEPFRNRGSFEPF